MKCPYCGHTQSRVVDSRQSDDALSIRRRRECEQCGRRFTTYERVDIAPLMVVKKDLTREAFDAGKLRTGLLRACEKRPVSVAKIDEIVDAVERELYNRFESEVESREIGEVVMRWLKQTDEVAYVRFASVYRQFRDIQTFFDELTLLLAEYQSGAGENRQAEQNENESHL